MRDPSTLNSQELARHAQQYLESLRSAGVEWLPNAPAPVRQPVAGPALTETAQSALLFDDVPAGHTDTAPPSGTPEVVPLEQRRVELQVLSRQVARLHALSRAGRDPVAKLCSASARRALNFAYRRGSGVDEDAQGEPFVGAAGQLLIGFWPLAN